MFICTFVMTLKTLFKIASESNISAGRIKCASDKVDIVHLSRVLKWRAMRSFNCFVQKKACFAKAMQTMLQFPHASSEAWSGRLDLLRLRLAPSGAVGKLQPRSQVRVNRSAGSS